MYTTLNEIFSHSPHKKIWARFLNNLGKTGPDNDPLPYGHILDSGGIYDAIWSLRCHPDTKLVRKFACDCVEGALKFFEEPYPDDNRPRDCVKAARDYIDGKITIDELREARKVTSEAIGDVYADTADSDSPAGYAAYAAYIVADFDDHNAYASAVELAFEAAYGNRKQQHEEQEWLFREYFCGEER